LQEPVSALAVTFQEVAAHQLAERLADTTQLVSTSSN